MIKLFVSFTTLLNRSIHVVLFSLLAVGCSEQKEARITKIEHIYYRSDNAEEDFKFFAEDLGLPSVWDYNNWGSFSSGGVSLGNLVLEIIDVQHSEKQLPYGLALKPEPDLHSVINYLATVGIQHDEIHRTDQWNLLALQGLLSNQIDLFICDYIDWNSVEKERHEAAAVLKKINGGTLGIQSVQQVVIGQSNEFQRQFEKLPGVHGSDSITRFEHGPVLGWNPSNNHKLLVVIQVNSLQQAIAKLDELQVTYQISGTDLRITDEKLAIEFLLMERE